MTEDRASGNPAWSAPAWSTPAQTPRLPAAIGLAREAGKRSGSTSTGWSPTAWKMGER